MTKTITQDKTILVLAFAATFIAGAAVFGIFSDYEAEAKPKDPKPPFIDPILKPINATLAEIQLQLDELKEDTDAIKSTGNDHGVILGDLDTKADGIKSVVDTIDAKVP